MSFAGGRPLSFSAYRASFFASSVRTAGTKPEMPFSSCSRSAERHSFSPGSALPIFSSAPGLPCRCGSGDHARLYCRRWRRYPGCGWQSGCARREFRTRRRQASHPLRSSGASWSWAGVPLDIHRSWSVSSCFTDTAPDLCQLRPPVTVPYSFVCRPGPSQTGDLPKTASFLARSRRRRTGCPLNGCDYRP